MTCQHCVQSVNKAVSTLPGVSSVNVDLAQKAATVTFDPASVSMAKLMQSVPKDGVKPTGFTRSA